MKREGYEHAKFKLVSRDLDMGLGAVRGYIDSIWHEAAMHFPAGDIGRYTNEEIAVAIDYRGDADELIAILVKRRLLDPIPEAEGRLYIHDWHEHCDDPSRRRDDPNRGFYACTKSQRRWERLRAAGGEIPPQIRLAVFTAAGWVCAACQATSDLTIDHVTPISRGGTNALTNLQCLCRPCNSRKKDR